MGTMSWYRQFRSLFLGAILATLVGFAGCTDPSTVPQQQGAVQAQVPFHGKGGMEDGSAVPGSLDVSQPKAPPFDESQSLPAGTLLMVRLKGDIEARTAVSPTSFEGILDEPVVVRGRTLIPRGVAVSGRVESFQASRLKPYRGYARLALESIQFQDLELPVQTASLFVRSSSAHRSTSLIRVERGHPLTFRLAEALDLTTLRAKLER
jgi:hypothetical protein